MRNAAIARMPATSASTASADAGAGPIRQKTITAKSTRRPNRTTWPTAGPQRRSQLTPDARMRPPAAAKMTARIPAGIEANAPPRTNPTVRTMQEIEPSSISVMGTRNLPSTPLHPQPPRSRHWQWPCRSTAIHFGPRVCATCTEYACLERLRVPQRLQVGERLPGVSAALLLAANTGLGRREGSHCRSHAAGAEHKPRLPRAEVGFRAGALCPWTATRSGRSPTLVPLHALNCAKRRPAPSRCTVLCARSVPRGASRASKPEPDSGETAGQAWCPRQDSNLRHMV